MSDISYMDLIGSDKSSDLSSKAADIYPFNIAPLDIVLGGGMYSGKIYEIYGRPSHGKSTIALEATKAFTNYCSKAPHIDKYAVLWIECESAFDMVKATYMGCDITRFRTQETDTIEGGFKIIIDTLDKCVKHGIRLFIVWDTIAAAQTEVDLKSEDGNMFGGGMGYIPRLLFHFLKKMAIPFGQTNSTMIFVNQVYESFGGNGGIESKGGGAIKFYSSVRMEVKSVGDIVGYTTGGAQVITGIISQIYTRKSKLSLPRQKVDIYLKGETGFERVQTVFSFLKAIKKLNVAGGGWTSFKIRDKDYKVQSWEKLREMVDFDPEVGDYLDYLVYDYFKDTSPLTKVRVINKLWEYEEKFLGKRVTNLSDRERDAALVLYNELQEENNEATESE